MENTRFRAILDNINDISGIRLIRERLALVNRQRQIIGGRGESYGNKD